jgi:hypothetical protein
MRPNARRAPPMAHLFRKKLSSQLVLPADAAAQGGA